MKENGKILYIYIYIYIFQINSLDLNFKTANQKCSYECSTVNKKWSSL